MEVAVINAQTQRVALESAIRVLDEIRMGKMTKEEDVKEAVSLCRDARIKILKEC